MLEQRKNFEVDWVNEHKTRLHKNMYIHTSGDRHSQIRIHTHTHTHTHAYDPPRVFVLNSCWYLFKGRRHFGNALRNEMNSGNVRFPSLDFSIRFWRSRKIFLKIIRIKKRVNQKKLRRRSNENVRRMVNWNKKHSPIELRAVTYDHINKFN